MRTTTILKILGLVIGIGGLTYEFFVVGPEQARSWFGGTEVGLLLLFVASFLEYRERRKSK